MLHHILKKNRALLLLLISVVWLLSCNKATVNFGDEALTDDPNIVYIDTMTINMSTYQTDSFYTAADTIFMTGIHNDTLLGNYEARAYMQVSIPAVNNLNGCTNCSFDSLAFITRFSGSHYGDTTEAFTLGAHRMTAQMIPDETSIGYNTSNYTFDPVPLGMAQFPAARPSTQALVSLRLTDAFGQTLFGMLKRNSDTITNVDLFVKYFNGMVLTGEGTHKQSVYYFANQVPGDNTVVRLYYHQNGITPVAGNVDFHANPSTYQFNTFTCDRSGTALAALTPYKKQVLPAAQTGNRVFLHSNGGIFPHFNFPNLFQIKELHPYVKVVKAVLEITPPDMNYGPGIFYTLPPALAAYPMDDNLTLGGALTTADGTAVQNGNLVVDYLYHKDTKYTYDLTGYINTILTTGRSAAQSLVMIPSANNYENRLILEAAKGNSSVKLKLYVLGL